MRGTVAKRLRREVYADHATNPKGRRYRTSIHTGQTLADEPRTVYQRLKRKRSTQVLRKPGMQGLPVVEYLRRMVRKEMR